MQPALISLSNSSVSCRSIITYVYQWLYCFVSPRFLPEIGHMYISYLLTYLLITKDCPLFINKAYCNWRHILLWNTTSRVDVAVIQVRGPDRRNSWAYAVAPERILKWGARVHKIFLVVLLHFFGSTSTISRFHERFRDGQYSLVSFVWSSYTPRCPVPSHL